MRTFLVLLVVLALAPAALAQCHVQRSYQSYTPTYSSHQTYQSYAPTYYAAPTYQTYAPVYYQQYPVAVPVYTAPPYYYSVQDSYRDSQQAKVIAYDILVGLAALNGLRQPAVQQQQNPYSQPPKAQQQHDLPPAQQPSGPNNGSFATAVNPAFHALVAAKCSRCHNASKPGGGISFDDLGGVPLTARHKSVQQVIAGTMPKGGPALSIEEQRFVKEWFADAAAQ